MGRGKELSTSPVTLTEIHTRATSHQAEAIRRCPVSHGRGISRRLPAAPPSFFEALKLPSVSLHSVRDQACKACQHSCKAFQHSCKAVGALRHVLQCCGVRRRKGRCSAMQDQTRVDPLLELKVCGKM